MASTCVAALGWFAQIALAARRGADVSQGAFLNVFAVLFLAVIPLAVGHLFFACSRRDRRQRAGDLAFSLAMIAQGIALASIGVAG